MVDAHDVFTNVGRLRNGRDVLRAVIEVRLRERSRIDLQNRILIKEVGGDHIVWEWLSSRKAVGAVERHLSRIAGNRNDRRDPFRRRVAEVLPCSGKVTCEDRILYRRRAPLDQSAPFFVPEEERPVLALVINMRNPEWAADISA